VPAIVFGLDDCKQASALDAAHAPLFTGSCASFPFPFEAALVAFGTQGASSPSPFSPSAALAVTFDPPPHAPPTPPTAGPLGSFERERLLGDDSLSFSFCWHMATNKNE
jgi:hypothetical protein